MFLSYLDTLEIFFLIDFVKATYAIEGLPIHTSTENGTTNDRLRLIFFCIRKDVMI